MNNEHSTSGTPDEPADIYGTLAPGQLYRRDGARLTGTADASMLKVSNTTTEHHRAYHRFDKAHLVMLIEMGLVPSEIGRTLLSTLHKLEAENEHLEMRMESEYGLHAGEAYLIETHGEKIGGWIHLGRSSRDLREVAVRSVAREQLLDLIDAALDLCTTLLDAAEHFDDAVMPSYTRLQHAQVTTFGSQLLAWERSIERSLDRLREEYRRVNVSPAGTAAGTGTTFPIDRERMAELLGFDGLANSASDVETNSDVHLAVVFDVLGLLHSIASIAEQLLMWSSEEFGFVEPADEHCGTSSIMPQKKNPLGLVGVQSRMKQAVSTAMAEFVQSRSIDGQATIDAAALESALEAVSTLDRIVGDLSFDRERAEKHVYLDWALATDLAALLVEQADLPWRSAHQICAILCRQSLEADRSIEAVNANDISRVAAEYLDTSITISEDALEKVLDAQHAIRSRKAVIGSPAPEQVRQQCEDSRRTVRNLSEWLAAENQRLATAERALSERTRELVASGDE